MLEGVLGLENVERDAESVAANAAAARARVRRAAFEGCESDDARRELLEQWRAEDPLEWARREAAAAVSVEVKA